MHQINRSALALALCAIGAFALANVPAHAAKRELLAAPGARY
ncbi:hypothetical protein ACFOLJ_24190 [Rugamonas sp. CCM 8940]|nr:hypothetical protein [Rugamonas sp. CCM 8940]